MPSDVLSPPQSRAWLRPGSCALQLGYVPLTDAAPLLVADEVGFFARHGVSVALTAAAGWAATRDRLAFDAVDGAQMLSPMPIALQLGLGGVQRDVTVAATLGLNGNMMVLSRALLGEMGGAGVADLARVIAQRTQAGRPAPVLAVVYPFSSHNYLLRRWLAAGGIDPERDLRMLVVPPSEMPELLAEGEIDGFCAGEPWGSRAADLDAGRIVTTTAEVWPNHPEKVLAFSTDLVVRDRPLVVAAVAAVIEAARWIAVPGNVARTVSILCRRAMPAMPPEIVALALEGRACAGPGETRTVAPLRISEDATFPDPAHGEAWLADMRRWGHVSQAASDVPGRVWQPALWREAAGLLGAGS